MVEGETVAIDVHGVVMANNVEEIEDEQRTVIARALENIEAVDDDIQITMRGIKRKIIEEAANRMRRNTHRSEEVPVVHTVRNETGHILFIRRKGPKNGSTQSPGTVVDSLQ